MSCADEEVYIVGGANSAGQAAMHFSRYAAKVHMLVRGESLDEEHVEVSDRPDRGDAEHRGGDAARRCLRWRAMTILNA